MKVDIRFITVSILIHLAIYSLLSLVQKNDLIVNDENIEVIIKDDNINNSAQKFIPDLNYQEEEKVHNKKATILSEKNRSFKKESIAKNDGNFAKNQVSTPKKKTSQETTYSEKGDAPSKFMPLEKNPMVQRTSSMHLELPHIPQGSLTFLNSEFSTYAAFFNRISPNIINFWGQNIREFAYFPQVRDQIILKDRWVTQIEVILDTKGYLKKITVVHSAGMPEFDHAVVDAIKSSAPFLNPPTGLIESDGFIHIHGQFSVITQKPRIAN